MNATPPDSLDVSPRCAEVDRAPAARDGAWNADAGVTALPSTPSTPRHGLLRRLGFAVSPPRGKEDRLCGRGQRSSIGRAERRARRRQVQRHVPIAARAVA